jgi:hypothetical protein
MLKNMMNFLIIGIDLATKRFITNYIDAQGSGGCPFIRVARKDFYLNLFT